MNKNKGFTLIEVLIATALLAFVIFLSSTLFDNAIQNKDILKKALSENSESASDIEEGILTVKEVYRYHSTSSKDPKKKPKNYDQIIGKDFGKGDKGAPIEIEIQGGLEITSPKGSKTNISKVKGYFVSVPQNTKDKIKYNDVIKEDKVFTFVSIGYIPSPSATIESVYLNNTHRFEYFPIKNKKTSNIAVQYDIKNDEYKKNVQASRLRFMRSPISSNNKIYSVFNDGSNSFSDDMTMDLFEYTGEERENKNKVGKIENYKISNYEGDFNLKKEYLNSIDRTYGASVIIFNLNGHSSNESTTFLNSKIGKQESIHFIGLPVIDNLSAHYDYNLALSKSKANPNKYYSVFDINNKDDSVNGDLLDKKGVYYLFDWKNKDIRNLLGIGNKTDDILIPKGFLNEIQKTDAFGNTKTVTDYNKAYGNTVYYRMGNPNESIKIPANKNFTFFIKYNTQNYNEKFNNSQDRYPYTLLSYNFDYDTGDMIKSNSRNKGFSLYTDKDGFVNYLERTQGENPHFEQKNFNINHSNLYTDSENLKFKSLMYDGNFKEKRDGRNGFNILSVVKSGHNIKVYMLERDKNEQNIQTRKIEIANININDFNGDFVFGSALNKVSKLQGAIETLENNDKDPVMEISDIIMYSDILSDRDINMTMDYLYRKYLTSIERNKFDGHFISKY